MSSHNDLYLPQCEKPRGADNCSEWKSKIESIINSRGLEAYIILEDMKPNDDDITFETYNTWMLGETEASLAIRLNILPEVLQILQPRDWQASDVNETAYEIWSKLEKIYG
jgi:hypothetical protein